MKKSLLIGATVCIGMVTLSDGHTTVCPSVEQFKDVLGVSSMHLTTNKLVGITGKKWSEMLEENAAKNHKAAPDVQSLSAIVGTTLVPSEGTFNFISERRVGNELTCTYSQSVDGEVYVYSVKAEINGSTPRSDGRMYQD
jgi:uncharacterized Zn-binding protein involved in type VI secretion